MVEVGAPERGTGSGESNAICRRNGECMSQLVLASVNKQLERQPAAQWAHDIRNALAIAGLNLETLARLSGPAGRKAAGSARAAVNHAADMCRASLVLSHHDGQGSRRCRFDVTQTIEAVVAILEPVVPPGFEIRRTRPAACMVMGDPSEIYRIVFNLVQNAVAAARGGMAMSYVGIAVAVVGPIVSVRIFDDGPGLPMAVRATLFRRQTASTATSNGFGIAIARELAERNGATLRLEDGGTGTDYFLELQGGPAIAGALSKPLADLASAGGF